MQWNICDDKFRVVKACGYGGILVPSTRSVPSPCLFPFPFSSRLTQEYGLLLLVLEPPLIVSILVLVVDKANAGTDVIPGRVEQKAEGYSDLEERIEEHSASQGSRRLPSRHTHRTRF
ncbi:hypothetical protein K488DRAFT_92825 [Vararia minispora EC-137]|uniref:Uncharacterized protein n=1 Tax=Vararia minispora EC-137 TaxID=1314806 RepID=A0ACB8Q3N9_9AGAM|nr:hypothetical protein K488DRAFT_92825 [Vararia minispora EC-137]